MAKRKRAGRAQLTDLETRREEARLRRAQAKLQAKEARKLLKQARKVAKRAKVELQRIGKKLKKLMVRGAAGKPKAKTVKKRSSTRARHSP
jgi:hypothetical protein